VRPSECGKEKAKPWGTMGEVGFGLLNTCGLGSNGRIRGKCFDGPIPGRINSNTTRTGSFLSVLTYKGEVKGKAEEKPNPLLQLLPFTPIPPPSPCPREELGKKGDNGGAGALNPPKYLQVLNYTSTKAKRIR